MEEVGKILPAILKPHLRRSQPPLIEILAPLWPRVVGKPLAQRCRPTTFSAGTLTLATDCSGWAVQLRHLTEEIRAEVNSFLGSSVVKKLRIRCVANLGAP